MNAALDTLCGFLLEHLPDSLRDRKSILAAMLLLLPKRHPLRARVNALRLLIESHEQHQLNLSLDFKSAAQYSGDGKGKSK